MFYSLLVKSRWEGAHLMAGLLLLALTAAGPLASTFACADVHARFLALGHVHLGVGLGDLEEDGAGRDFTLLDQDGLDQDWDRDWWCRMTGGCRTTTGGWLMKMRDGGGRT